MTEAYQLHWEEQHLNDMDADTDIVLERRADDADLPNWPEGTESPDVTGETVFGATFGQVSYTHYPVNDLRWPVMSRQMLDTLLSVGAFPHVAHPVAIVDALHYRGEALPLGEGWYAGRLPDADRSYVLVQLTEHLDVLDESRSAMSRGDTPEETVVYGYALKPGSSLPPLFRTRVGSGQLLISAAGRHALASAGIAGPVYVDLGGRGEEEVDVPVPEVVLPAGI